jgi:hypothetical protein
LAYQKQKTVQPDGLHGSLFCWRKKHKNSKIPKFLWPKCSKIPKFASLLSFGRSFRVSCITTHFIGKTPFLCKRIIHRSSFYSTTNHFY